MEGINSLRYPFINHTDFEAVTTHGVIRLSDYKGKWVTLFSHPADFTPACTTEFIAFAKVQEEECGADRFER